MSPARRALLPLAGVAVVVFLWWLLTEVIFASAPLVGDLTPTRTVTGLVELAASGALLADASASMFRLVAGLVVATVLGVAVGVVVGASEAIDRALRPVLLFLRMISPLSWAPLAVGLFGVGDLPVVALVAATALWSIALATSDGIRGVDPTLLVVARAFGATKAQAARRVVWPSVRPRLLGGLRGAIGIAWVVLVPAEMFGVTSGLGYQILNSKDQLAYERLGALLLVIGTLGYCVDVVARWLLRTPRERVEELRAHAAEDDRIEHVEKAAR